MWIMKRSSPQRQTASLDLGQTLCELKKNSMPAGAFNKSKDMSDALVGAAGFEPATSRAQAAYHDHARPRPLKDASGKSQPLLAIMFCKEDFWATFRSVWV
jgi:hypothetical protein